MPRTILAPIGFAALVVAIIAGAMFGGNMIPGSHAMPLVDSISQMHGGWHHDGDHQGTHHHGGGHRMDHTGGGTCTYSDDVEGSRCPERQHGSMHNVGSAGCPFGAGSTTMMSGQDCSRLHHSTRSE